MRWRGRDSPGVDFPPAPASSRSRGPRTLQFLPMPQYQILLDRPRNTQIGPLAEIADRGFRVDPLLESRKQLLAPTPERSGTSFLIAPGSRRRARVWGPHKNREGDASSSNGRQ